jgi:hypothetical protein
MFEATDTTEELTTTTTAEKPRFCIDSQFTADWLLRKLANIEAEKERVKIYARTRCAELEADAARLESQFGEQLKQWATEEAERRRRKSVTLPNGVLSFRTTGPRLILADVDTAAEYAASQNFATKTVLDSAAYRDAAEKHFTETGEVLPGIERTEGGESFSIRFPKSAKDTGTESNTDSDTSEGKEG